MRNKKHVALISMLVIFILLAIIICYFTDENTKRSGSHDAGELCINEVCSSYFPTSFSETQPASDWIELYNASDKKINLKNYYLSDSKADLQKYNLPSVELEPDSFFVIHSECDEMTAEDIQLNFRISSNGENLYLSSQEGIVDFVKVPAMNTNTAWSRLTDGGQEWKKTRLTYNFSNDGAELVLEEIEAPAFSADSGFYEDEFDLELKALPESVIYYTLDGSDPDAESIQYQGPIRLKDRSEEPNVYSARKDLDPSYDSYAEDIMEKITVVRAIAIDSEGKKSRIVTNSYIIGKNDDKSYKEMYTVSLVTDPYNLFNYDEGIYVLGKRYDEYLTEPDNYNEVQANYTVHGKRSERPASIEIFDKNGVCILDKEVGIRIHGHTTRKYPQKSFSVYSRKMYDGEDTIKGFWKEDMDIHKFFLYTSSDMTKVRDTLISKMLADRDIATQSFNYCNVFLDGEYWGVYLLAEVYDEYYFKNHYGFELDNVQFYETTPPSDVMQYLNTVSDRSEDEVYEKLCQMIDVQSFIDYFAAMLYLNDYDWLNYNVICYRCIVPGDEENQDGRWRWGIWDIEDIMNNADVNTFHHGNNLSWEDDQLAQTLMEHEEFRKQFVITYMDLYNNIWQEDNILPVVTELENSITESYAMHLERFYARNDNSEYMNKVKEFLSDRKESAFRHVKEEFNLSQDLVWLVILSNKEGAASIKVNTSVINMPETWWQGLYFQDYPVEISIEEIYEDSTFLGWYTESGELLGTDETITINLDNETTIICPQFD